MDKTIGLWDINTQQRAHTLRGHDKGVFQLAYNADYQALVSASCEHSAIVWNPYCQLQICQLKGHTSPLVGVVAVTDSPQILTADEGAPLPIVTKRLNSIA
jgi:WD40 repeat protein